MIVDSDSLSITHTLIRAFELRLVTTVMRRESIVLLVTETANVILPL